MWRLALAAVPLTVVVLALATGVASQADTPTATPEPSPSPSPFPSPSPAPATPELLPPVPAPTPFDHKGGEPGTAPIDPAYTGSLRPGDWVQLTNTDSCLNVRMEPRMPVPQPDGTLYDNILNCLPDGFVGRLDGYVWGDKTTLPVSADGRWWWHIVGQGWAAEEWLTFHHQGGIPWPDRLDLASAALIAYLRVDNSVWLMNADGSGQRQIVASPGQSAYIQSLRWSPAGDRLAYTLRRWDIAQGPITTQVIDLTGTIVAEYPGLADALWSPGGGRFSAIRVDRDGELGGYYGTPVVLDLATGAEIPVGRVAFANTAPTWSPDGSSLAFVCASNYIGQPDGSFVIDPDRSCGGDGLRIAAADGSSSRLVLPMDAQTGFYFSSPSWSPSGATIARWSLQEGSGCRGYALIDVAGRATGECISPPPLAGFAGGSCGGGAEMGASHWTPDGSSLLFAAQGADSSGVFVADVFSERQTVIPSMNAMSISVAANRGDLTFAGGGYIWVAGLDGSNLALLAEGHSPAWQPRK